MLKREMEAPEFDREKVKHEVMAIADPEKSEIVRRQQEAETIAKEKEERQQREEAEKPALPPKLNALISGISLTALSMR